MRKFLVFKVFENNSTKIEKDFERSFLVNYENFKFFIIKISKKNLFLFRNFEIFLLMCQIFLRILFIT